jgi:hypothetical protein
LGWKSVTAAFIRYLQNSMQSYNDPRETSINNQTHSLIDPRHPQ